MSSEERVMRAREGMIAELRRAGVRAPLDPTIQPFLEAGVRAMLAFADEGSGIGGWACVNALDEAAAQCTRVGVETTFAAEMSADFQRGYKAGADFCQMVLHQMAKEAARKIPLSASPDIDRSGLAQEVEQSRADQLLADDLDYVAGKPVE